MRDWAKTPLNPQQMLLTPEELAALPKLYAQDGKGLEATCFVHFFGGPYDLWATEFDPEEGVFFGFVRIAGLGPGELGYVTAEELVEAKVPLRIGGRTFNTPLERDAHWTPKALRECV